jgi:hypothetical protein
MSHCNRRKLMINEEEKVAILSLYGLMTEQANSSAVQSTSGPDEMNLTGKSFFDNGKWKNMSPKGKQELDNQLSEASKFLAAKKGRVVYIKIKSGESQVTNSDNEVTPHVQVEPGYLSEKRAATMKAYLTKYFESLKGQGIISQMPIFEAPESIIGTTSYTKGVDNPNDSKYEPERYVNVELKLQSPEKCVVGLTVEVMYNDTETGGFPCRGGHKCDEAKFAVKLNGVKIGEANLNNVNDGKSRTSGKIVVNDAQAKQIIGNQSKDIVISLQCLSGSNCHSSTPEVKISKGTSVIYWGCSPSIAARGETNEKTILVLDNCGNLKQKGTDTGKKTEGGVTTTALPKLTGKTVEFPIGLNGDPIVSRDKLISAKWIDSKVQKDGSYIAIKDMGINRGIVTGDKVIFVKKYSPRFVKPVSPETVVTQGKKWVDTKVAQAITDPKLLTIPPKDVYILLKNLTYGNRNYKVGEVIKLTS